MSIYLYDKAVTEKLQHWIKDKDLKITYPGETRRLFSYIADITHDSPIKLPLIALRRNSSVQLLNTNKSSRTYDGVVIQANTNRTEVLNVVPISLTYQLDIYCREMIEAEQYARNFIFNLINYPKLRVSIPYNNSFIEHDSNISLQGELVDNSDIPERLFPGEFTRFTLTFTIPDAYLFSVPIRDNIKLEAGIDIKLENTTNITSEKII